MNLSSPLYSFTFSTTTEPSTPAFSHSVRSGCSSARLTIWTPTFSSPSSSVASRSSAAEAAQVRDAAARHDALLDRRTGRVQRVLDAGLLLLHLGLGRRTDVDHRDTARELGQTLLQLLAIVVGGRVVDLALDLTDAALDVGRLAGALDDRGVFLVDHDPLGAAQVLDLHVLELDAEVLGDQLAAR